MDALVTCLVKNLVDHPDAVQVTVKHEEDKTLIEIRVASEDVGKIVGKQGRIIKSLRVLVAAISSRFGRHTQLELIRR